MALCRHHLPGFRGTCLGIGGLFVVLALMQLVQGIPKSMAGFGIPEAVLASPHYQDAMTWVFTHMLVLGATIATVGHFAESPRTRRAFARLMAAALVVYLIYDLRTSDSAVGNALYAGARSLVPPAIDVVALLLFLHVGFCRSATEPTAARV